MLCPSLDCALLIPLSSYYHRADHAIHISMWGCYSLSHSLPCPENVALLLRSYPGPAVPSSCQHQLCNVTKGSLSSHPGCDMPPHQPSSPHCGTPGHLEATVRSRQMGSCKHLDENKFGNKAPRQAASSPLRSVPDHNHEKRSFFHHSVLRSSFAIPTPRRCMFRKSKAADGWHCSARTHPCRLPDPRAEVKTSLVQCHKLHVNPAATTNHGAMSTRLAGRGLKFHLPGALHPQIQPCLRPQLKPLK